MKAKKEKVIPKKSQRCSTAYNTLPTKVARTEFNRFIKPYLSMSAREKPHLSYFKIFNYILYVLHTGIQWENLPVKEVHFTNIYRHHNRWSKDGSYEKIFNGSLLFLSEEGILNLSVLHGDGSNVVAKKGAPVLATRDTNTREARNPLILKTIRGMYSSRVSRRR
jgi:transposase